MKGKNPTAAQKRFHDALCKHVGCIACLIEFGAFNGVVSVHHIDGRTKPHAHWWVLPLCAGHHQDGYGPVPLIAVHPYKARFEAKFGSQMQLLEHCKAMVRDKGYKGPMGEEYEQAFA